MALYLPTTDSLILLAPKTGSRWVAAAVKASGVRHDEIGPPDLGGHGDLFVHGRNHRFVACFVRHPVDWYRSYWAYRMERGWRERYELDRRCRSDSFRGFVRNAVRYMPGVLSALYERYAGPSDNPVRFIGRQEALAHDLVRMLHAAGEHFDEAALRAVSRVNRTRTEAHVTDELRELITVAEFGACHRFGYLDYDRYGLRDLLTDYPADFANLRKLILWTSITHWQYDDMNEARGRPPPGGRRLARVRGNLALYLETVCGAHDEAEKLYQSAVAADPDHPRTLGNFALFMQHVRGDCLRCQELFRRALDVRPAHAHNLGNYALFLHGTVRDFDLAEEYYRRAIAVEPRHARNLGNYAVFLQCARGRVDEAEALYQRAIEADPFMAANLANYAHFRHTMRADRVAAEALYRRAVAADPDEAAILGEFALFQERVCGNFDVAEQYYQKAIEKASASARVLAEFARFLADVRADQIRSEALYRRAYDMLTRQSLDRGQKLGPVRDQSPDGRRLDSSFPDRGGS